MEEVRPIGGMSVDSCFVSHSGSLEDSISLLEGCPCDKLASCLEVILLRIEQEEARDELWNRVFSSLSKKLCEVLHDRVAFCSLFGETIKTVLCHTDKNPSVGLRENMKTFVGCLMDKLTLVGKGDAAYIQWSR